MTTAAQAIVDALIAEEITHVFCVPGESYLALLDALADRRDAITVITCRQEAGAANMAEAYGKLTGRPGICMVTRGPGATNASIGVHTAQQDGTPMILFVGQIARADRGRGAFQEVDYGQMFGGLAKLALELGDAARTQEVVHRAFATAGQGRHGPILIALPEDMLGEGAAPLPYPETTPTAQGLDAATLARIGERLEAAERPVMILGGGGWDRAALDALRQWAGGCGLPVALGFRRKDLWDNDHPCYIGDLGLGANPALLATVGDADLVLALGARLGDITTQGYTLFDRPTTAERLIQILPEPSDLGRVWPASLAICANPSAAAHALSTLGVTRNWSQASSIGHDAMLRFTAPVTVTGAVNLSEIFAALHEQVGDDAILCNGAGNFAAWLHRFHRHRMPGTQLAPTSGAMGYGLPAAVAAKLLHPDRTVVVVAGDGDFMMTGQELATAVQYSANIIVLVVDNGSYGTIRMHQEREYPYRVSATDLRNPDFAMLARAYGCWSARVERTEDFAPALEEALKAGTPALIHLTTTIKDIAPGRTIESLRKLRADGKTFNPLPQAGEEGPAAKGSGR